MEQDFICGQERL